MQRHGADVRVIGVGGAGGNAIRSMFEREIAGATLIVANTDRQALDEHPVDHRLVLGPRTTGGLGAGGRPSVGLAAAQESSRELAAMIGEADLVFVTTGLGGGTGTGAAPLVAHLAREAGALVVGVVSMPFSFEGGRRARIAQAGLDALEEQVDSLLVIENDRLLSLDAGVDPTMLEAFALADEVLDDGVRGIGDLVLQTGFINLDFADVAAVLRDGGRAVLAMGEGRGPERALRAVEAAVSSPLLAEGDIEGAQGVLMSFTVDSRLGLNQIHRAAQRVQAEADDEAEILFGVSVDPTLEDEVRVTLCAAGVGQMRAPVEQAPAVSQVRSLRSQRPHEPAFVARRRNALVMLER